MNNMENIKYKVHLTDNYQNQAADKLISKLLIRLSANEEYIKELEEQQQLKKFEGEVKYYKNLYLQHKNRCEKYKQKYEDSIKELKKHPEYQKLEQQVYNLIKIRDNLINKYYANNNK